jgi:hypothetical protein
MKTAIRSAVLGMTCLLCLSQARSQDWPQWRGPERDGVAQGFKPPATWPEELAKKWSVPVGDGVATPAGFQARRTGGRFLSKTRASCGICVRACETSRKPVHYK